MTEMRTRKDKSTMKMQKCPKCGSTNIDTGKVQSAGTIGYKSDEHKVLFNSNTHSYCCLDCGYVETYVDQEYLERIKAKK